MFDLERLIKDLNIKKSELSAIVGKGDTAVSNNIKRNSLPYDWEIAIQKVYPHVNFTEYYINKRNNDVNDILMEPQEEYHTPINKVIETISDANKTLSTSNEILASTNKQLSEVNSRLQDQLIKINEKLLSLINLKELV